MLYFRHNIAKKKKEAIEKGKMKKNQKMVILNKKNEGSKSKNKKKNISRIIFP